MVDISPFVSLTDRGKGAAELFAFIESRGYDKFVCLIDEAPETPYPDRCKILFEGENLIITGFGGQSTVQVI